MRIVLATLVAATAVSTVSASEALAAADSQWTGFYGGIQLGIDGTRNKASGTDTVNFSGGEGFFGGTEPFKNRDMQNDFMAGATVGYNYQFGRFIVGVEGDASWLDSKTSRATFDGPEGTGTLFSRTNGLETIRGRLGFLLNDVYVFGTGGAAFSNTTIGLTNEEGLSAMVHMNNGWTAGGGVETFVCPNFSVAAKFMYVELDGKSASASNSFSSVFLHGSSAQYLWTVGLNYHL